MYIYTHTHTHIYMYYYYYNIIYYYFYNNCFHSSLKTLRHQVATDATSEAGRHKW
jgi:hypothetical protein